MKKRRAVWDLKYAYGPKFRAIHKGDGLVLRNPSEPDPDPACYVEGAVRWDGALCSFDGRRWTIHGGTGCFWSGELAGPYAPVPLKLRMGAGRDTPGLTTALLRAGASYSEALAASSTSLADYHGPGCPGCP